jgi:hypothetical protein
MTPRFYGYLWMAFSLIALAALVASGFSLLAWVVLGFITFGLIWAGMICVLPGMSAGSHEDTESETTFEERLPAKISASRVQSGSFARYRSA